jgi:hypothetical protein
MPCNKLVLVICPRGLNENLQDTNPIKLCHSNIIYSKTIIHCPLHCWHAMEHQTVYEFGPIQRIGTGGKMQLLGL